MDDKRLLIADGHHRYETAMAFRRDHPDLAAAGRMMMAFFNMDAPGLRILAAHRLVSGVDTTDFLAKAGEEFAVQEIASIDELKSSWAKIGDRTVIGVAMGGKLYRLTHHTARGQLDLTVLHDGLIGKALGISEEAVREEKHLHYIRGIDAALEEVRNGAAQ